MSKNNLISFYKRKNLNIFNEIFFKFVEIFYVLCDIVSHSVSIDIWMFARDWKIDDWNIIRSASDPIKFFEGGKKVC